jgi:hypothetical protein
LKTLWRPGSPLRISRLQAAEVAAEEELARRQRENLARLQRLCDQLETLARSAEPSLKDGERGLRDARTALDDLGPLPSRGEHEELTARLRNAHAALVPRVRELREIDEWQRWANAGVQEELCRRAESLREVADPAEAARQLAELQARWKQVPTAPRERSQSLWLRFRTAADEVRARSDQHSRSRPGSGPPPGRQRGALPAGRSAGRLDRLDQDRREIKAAGGVEGDWAGPRAAKGRPGNASAPPVIGSSRDARRTWRGARRSGPRTW